jgi:hypothetical protein
MKNKNRLINGAGVILGFIAGVMSGIYLLDNNWKYAIFMLFAILGIAVFTVVTLALILDDSTEDRSYPDPEKFDKNYEK